MTLDARKDRTALRLKLYENGFTPLANKSKMCLLPGWSTFEVTPEMIQSKEWARSRNFSDTGIRCGDVIALDWDIDDKALLNKLLDAVVEQGLVDESSFVRIGRAPRELWVYRTAEKIGKRTTGHFMPPDHGEDHKGFAVEILGAGCQFAAYGQRDAEHAYSWPETSLLDARYMDLPEITKAQADAVKDFAIAFFESRGLERKSPAGGTDSGYTHAYDLTPEMVFEVHDMGPMTIAEIGEALRLAPAGEVLRCRVDALRPTTGSWAGMISLVNGDVCLSDHGTYTSHFPEGSNDAAALERLGALLAERFPQIDEEPEPEPITDFTMDPLLPLDDNFAVAKQRFVWVANDGLVVDLAAGFMTQPIRVFRDTMAPFYEVKAGPRGGEVITELAEMWRRDPNRLVANTMQMRPDMPRPLFVENGQPQLNTYAPVTHRAGGVADTGLQMIANLLPIDAERQFFLQWLAYKIAHPEVPGPAVVMVAHDSYGTGRGSLISLLTDIFSPRYTARIDFDTLAGRGSQSQYNEWLVDNLMVAVDEAQDLSGAQSKWHARHNAYEHLKKIIDPAAREIEVKRKGVKNGKGRTYASILVATNHSDALVIPTNDRRISVLENGEPLPQSYWDVFHHWRLQPGNVGAFIEAVLRTDMTGYNPMAAPPMTRAKADMIDAGMSELDRAVTQVLGACEGALLTKEQLTLKLEDYLVENAIEFPEEWHRSLDAVFKRATRKIMGEDRLVIGGRRCVVRMVRQCDKDILKNEQLMLDEVVRNGPLVRPIRSSAQVVNFPGR